MEGAAMDRSEASTPLPAELLEILACPACKAPVRQEGNRIVCTRCGRRYPIEDDIPILLIDAAELPPQPMAPSS